MNSTECETLAVASNVAENGRKFHLRDSITNRYLIVEATTKVLRTVSFEEFQIVKQNESEIMMLLRHLKRKPFNLLPLDDKVFRLKIS